jgi:hypothetical protein
MGEISFILCIDGITSEQITVVKSVIDAQIATWQTTYPTLVFGRGKMNWAEKD